MTTKTIKFTKSALSSLIKNGVCLTVKDSEIKGLKFAIGKSRAVFLFEKRISGSKAAALTITIGSYPAFSIDDARIEAYRLANLCERGIDPRRKNVLRSSPMGIPLGDMIDKFFEAKSEIAIPTLSKYRTEINRIPSDWLSKPWEEITADMIVEQFHKIRKIARDRCWEFVKVINNVFNTCAPFFRDGDGDRILKTNPIPEVRLMLKSIQRDTPQRPFIPAFTLGKFVVLLETIRKTGKLTIPSSGNRINSELVLLGLFTGFRFKELRWLKWDYVDLDQGAIMLPGNAAAFQTKNRQDHGVSLPSYAWDLLKEIARERGQNGPFVFPSVKNPNKPVFRSGTFYDSFSKMLGLHFSPHATRRTFASIANEVGIGFLDVKRLLNHHFEGGVTGGYVVQGFNPTRQRENSQKICDYILDCRAQYLGRATQEQVCAAGTQGIEPDHLQTRLEPLEGT